MSVGAATDETSGADDEASSLAEDTLGNPTDDPGEPAHASETKDHTDADDGEEGLR